MQRTNRTVDLSILVAHAGAVQQLLAASASLSVRVAWSWLTTCRPRYLLHGTVALIGMATVTAFALQPRPAVSSNSAAATAAIANPSPPLMALNLAEPTPVVVDEEPAATPTDVAEQEPPAKPFMHTVEEG